MPLSPAPWERGESENCDLARLLDAMWRRRWRLAPHYPWVPVTPARVYSQFHGGFGPYPAGAVVRLWTHCAYLRGTCPGCAGDVLGFSFGGNLSRGHIHGICLRCAAWLRRPVDGIGDYMSAIRPALEDSPTGPRTWPAASPRMATATSWSTASCWRHLMGADVLVQPDVFVVPAEQARTLEWNWR